MAKVGTDNVSTLRIKDVRSVTIKALRNKTRVQLILNASGAGPYESIHIDLERLLALAVAAEMKELLASATTPSPPTRATTGARAKFRVVK
jgi:hypothetical protein